MNTKAIDLAKLKKGISVMKKLKEDLDSEEDDESMGVENGSEVEDDEEDAEKISNVEEETPEETAVAPQGVADIPSQDEIAAQIEKATEELDDELSKSAISESVKNKVKSLLKLKEEEQIKDLEDKFDSYKKEYEEEMLDKQDEYLSQVADEWLNNNKVAVESSIKTKIAEGFIEDFKDLMKKWNLSLPEEEANMIDQYKQENDELKDEINKQVSEAVKAKKALKEAKKELCLEKLSNNSKLAKSEKIKLRKLSEEIDYKDDEQFYDDLDRAADKISEEDEEEIAPEQNVEINDVVPAEVEPEEEKPESVEEAISKFLSK